VSEGQIGKGRRSEVVEEEANKIRVFQDLVLVLGRRDILFSRNGLLVDVERVHEGEELFAMKPILRIGRVSGVGEKGETWCVSSS
jgi:hypothetical protein